MLGSHLFPTAVQKTPDAGVTSGATILRIATAIKRSIPFAFPKDLPVLEFALDQVTLTLDSFGKDALLQNEHLTSIFGRSTQDEWRSCMVNGYKEMFRNTRKELLIRLIREVNDDKALSRVYKILLKASKER